MIIEFHLTGENRKALVKAISEILEISAEYQYMRLVLTRSGNVIPSPKRATLKSAILLTEKRLKC